MMYTHCPRPGPDFGWSENPLRAGPGGPQRRGCAAPTPSWDALLGAAGLGDIGLHFPDTDMRYKGADSGKLLDSVGEKIDAAGYKVGNIDVTMIAQRPKLRPYIDRMRENIATHLGIDPRQGQRKGYHGGAPGLYRRGQGAWPAMRCACWKKNEKRKR